MTSLFRASRKSKQFKIAPQNQIKQVIIVRLSRQPPSRGEKRQHAARERERGEREREREREERERRERERERERREREISPL